MPEQKQHPSVDDLTAFSAGQLPPESAASVESHIGDCTPCCETLMGLSSDDTFVDLLKETRDPVNGATIGIANCASDTQQVSSQAALANHPRYEIVDLIAKGGMGEVFKAKHRMMDRTVALKVIKDEFTRNPEAVERFHREVKTAAHLSHRNVVTAYDAEQADGVHFLVMEYVDGENLADLVKASGRLTVETACEYTQQVALGMQHAHDEGMVHRDMKPHNLMLTTDGTVKILDFGLSSLSSATSTTDDSEMSENASLTMAGSIMGTPDFISPEQAADARQADIRSDIYSLGATLHYLLTGQPPFAEGSVADRLRSHAEEEPALVSSFRDDIPEGLTAVIGRMMAKDPATRFQTPQQVVDALAPFVDAHRSQPQTASGRRASWKSGKLLAAAAAIAVILSGIIYVQTDKGTLMIDAIDNDVNLTISRVTGKSGTEDIQLDIVDTVTGTNVIRLPSGDYKVSLEDSQNKYTLDQEGFTLTRGDDVIITVSRATTADKDSSPETVAEMTLPAMAQQAYLSQGRMLTADEVEKLENTAKKDSTDIATRLQLLSYYSSNSLFNADARPRHIELATWFVQNYPESDTAKSNAASVYPHVAPEGYLQLKTLWLEHVKKQPENVTIRRHAATFLQLHDRTMAEKLLQEARKLAPQDSEAAEQLGQIYRLGLIGMEGVDIRREQAKKAMLQFQDAVKYEGKTKNFHWLVSLAKMAIEAGDVELAHQTATQLLESSSDGKATHHGNVVLGRVALAQGNMDVAKARLLDAARVVDGIGITTSGPNMSLAKELLEQGEKEVVLEYFKLCENFWKAEELKIWAAEVERGETPEFGANLAY